MAMISDWITRITTCFEMRIASQGALRSPTGAEGTRPGPSMVQEYLQEGVCGIGIIESNSNASYGDTEVTVPSGGSDAAEGSTKGNGFKEHTL